MSYKTDSFDRTVIELLNSGAIGLLPSDTIYGLSSRALDKTAVDRLHEVKHRDKTKPFVVLISKIEQLNDLGIITTDAAPALRYWPGKLTMVLPAAKVPAWLHMGTKTLAVRQPGYPELMDLIDKTGPIISTSANISGGQPAASVKQAREYFGDKLDFYVDVGPLRGQPSTIAKVDNFKIKILRQGAIIINT